MQNYKIEIFERENPARKLNYVSLNSKDSKWILSMLYKLSGIDYSPIDTPLFFRTILESFNKISFNEEISKSDLTSLFQRLGIAPNSLIYIVWNVESSIDQLRLNDIIDFWDYIWYGSSDEAIVLYSPSSEIILLITDDDCISLSPGADDYFSKELITKN